MASSPEELKATPRALTGVRIAIGASLALLAAVLGWIVALGLQTDPREKRALQTPGAIIAVTVGTEALVIGANWQKIALRANPSSRQRSEGPY